MKNRDALIAAIILAILFWPRRSTDVNLYQSCVYPDGYSELVPLGDACPWNDAHGGQSMVIEA